MIVVDYERRLLRAEGDRDVAQADAAAARRQVDVLAEQVTELRAELVEMRRDRDSWRDTAQRNREESKELERALAAERKANALEAARLRAAAFPPDRQPPDVAGCDDAEARFALLELDEG